jgi:hypothetical protein
MSGVPRMLDDEILGELELRWRRLGTTMAERMEPGLDDDEIDQITAPLGFSLPEEARRVFRWHQGSSLAPLAAYRTLIPLGTCVQSTLDFLEDDDDWPRGWVSFMDEKPYMALDCRGGPDDPVAVWHYDYAHQQLPTRPVFASIGELFLFWISLIDDGHMTRDAPRWDLRQPLPADIRAKLAGVPSD